MGSAVLLYHHGLVFDREDMQRFLKTQTSLCWNGDLEAPRYCTVDGQPAKEGEVFSALPLSAFDEKLAALNFQGPTQAQRLARSNSPWQGGVVAGEWLLEKYVLNNSASPHHAEYGTRFLAQAAPTLRAELAFSPRPPGHFTPPQPTTEALASMRQ